MRRVLGFLFAMLVAASLGAAGADEPLTPAGISLEELLEKHRAALGTLASGTYHIVRRSTQNGEIATIETYTNGVDYRSTFTDADIVWQWGELNGRKWEQGANGFVRFDTGDWGADDPLAIAVSHLGGATAKLLGVTGAPERYVVEVAPENGLWEKRYYDAATFLLRKIEWHDYDGHIRATQYDDYRRVAGREVAFRRIESSDVSSAVTEYDTVVYEPVASHPDFSIPESKPLFDLGGRESVEIPSEFTPYGIVVRMSVGQRGLDLLLDSGAPTVAINAQVASELGLTPHDKRVESFGGTYESFDARAADISIGSLHAPSAAITVDPVDYLVDVNARVVGLLGCDFIASGVLKVDFVAKRLTMYARLPDEVTSPGWTKLPIGLDACVPLVHAAISGRPGRFILDLGADATILYPHYMAAFKIPLPKHGDPEVRYGRFIGGDRVKFFGYTMRELDLGDLAISGVRVLSPAGTTVQDRQYDGLLGRLLLSNFTLIFDYAHAAVYLKPNP